MSLKDYPCRTTYMETKQMGNSTSLAGKIEHVQFTMQDCASYPARLHASYCATLQRVGYLARCCTQYIARYLARNIASCRQALTEKVMNISRHTKEQWKNEVDSDEKDE